MGFPYPVEDEQRGTVFYDSDTGEEVAPPAIRPSDTSETTMEYAPQPSAQIASADDNLRPLPETANSPTPEPFDVRKNVDSTMTALGLLQAGSQGAGNIANIFHPGASDSAGTARLFDQYRAQAQQPLRDEDARIKKAELAQKEAEKRAPADPGSDLSRRAAADFIERRTQNADFFDKAGQPQLAETLRLAASNATQRSASELAQVDAHLDKLIGQAIGVQRNEALGSQATANLGLRGETLAETQKQHATSNELSQKELELKEKALEQSTKEHSPEMKVRFQQQEKLNKEVENLGQTIELLKDVQRIKKEKKVNTGYAAAIGNKARQMVGAEPEGWDELETQLATVNNKIVKEFAGSAVSAGEWSRITQQIPTVDKDDPNFDKKLALAIKNAEALLVRRVREYQRTKSGEAIDLSETSQQATDPAHVPAAVPQDKAKIERARKAAKLGTPAQQKNARDYLRSVGASP